MKNPVFSRNTVTPESSSVLASCIRAEEEIVNVQVKDPQFILLIASIAIPKTLVVVSDILPGINKQCSNMLVRFRSRTLEKIQTLNIFTLQQLCDGHCTMRWSVVAHEKELCAPSRSKQGERRFK